jgi:hypothetical protein
MEVTGTQNRRHRRSMSAVRFGSGGGGIRTRDLWVMSPTSCRCSTPRRRDAGTMLPGRWGGAGVPAAASPPTGSPPQYSPALCWVTTGFGMGPGGASALSATDTPAPPWALVIYVCGARPRPAAPGRERGAQGGERKGSTLGHEHGSAPVGCPPSTSRLATGSSARGLSHLSDGETRLGAGFPLRCFQRFAHPDVATQRCRLPDNWHTSGPSSPVLSY